MGYDLRGVWNDFADVHSMLYRRPDLDFGILEEINLVCWLASQVPFLIIRWQNCLDHILIFHIICTANYKLNLIFYEQSDGSLLWEEFGCPRDKLVLGVPFYGRSFTLSDPSLHGLHAPITGTGNPGPIIGDPTVLVYFEVGSFYNLIIRETFEQT